MKETQIFKEFGFVYKNDLVDVYLNKKKKRLIEDSDEDVLLLI